MTQLSNEAHVVLCNAYIADSNKVKLLPEQLERAFYEEVEGRHSCGAMARCGRSLFRCGEWKGWRRKDGERVKNIDLWSALQTVARPHRITWQWVKGHDGNEGNGRVDVLSKEARKLAEQSNDAIDTGYEQERKRLWIGEI